MDASGSGPTPSSALPGGLGASRLSGLLLGAGAARWHLWSAGAGEQLRARWPYLAALGAGCLVGAGGVFLAQRLSRRVATLTSHDSSASITRELTSLHVTVRDLREAVRELKETQRQEGGTARRGGKNGRLKSALRTVTFSDVDEAFKERSEEGDEEDEDETLNGGASSTTMTTTNSTTEFFSCISSEEEYFDLPEDEDAAAAEGGTSASEDKRPRAESDIILELFRAVDDLLEGGQGEQRKALRLLRARQEQVLQLNPFLRNDHNCMKYFVVFCCSSLVSIVVLTATFFLSSAGRKQRVPVASVQGHLPWSRCRGGWRLPHQRFSGQRQQQHDAALGRRCVRQRQASPHRGGGGVRPPSSGEQ